MSSKHFEFQSWPVYREAIVLTKECFQFCGKVPKDGARSLVDQLRRASQSVPLNIAEGSARYTRADKINFLRIARGSVFECVAIFDVFGGLYPGLNCDFDVIGERLNALGKMLSGLIRYIETHRPEKAGNP